MVNCRYLFDVEASIADQNMPGEDGSQVIRDAMCPYVHTTALSFFIRLQFDGTYFIHKSMIALSTECLAKCTEETIRVGQAPTR